MHPRPNAPKTPTHPNALQPTKTRVFSPEMLKVYEYDKCSTCKKALKFLDTRKVKYEKLPIVDRPPSMTELKKMLGFVGDVRKLFNTSGMVYREMKLGEKLPSMSEA